MCRPEALRCVVNQERPEGAGHDFQPNEISRHPIKTRGDKAERLSEIESSQGIQVQITISRRSEHCRNALRRTAKEARPQEINKQFCIPRRSRRASANPR